MSFSNERASAPPQKPNIVATLGGIIYDYQREGVLAYEMPNDPQGGAKWFMGRMEPQQRGEGMLLIRAKDGTEHWEFPYLERMKYLLMRYFHEPDSAQAIIIGCCEEGVYWRGETLEHFYEAETSVYNEVIRMREIGAPEYIKQAVAKMKALEFGSFGKKKDSEEDSEPCIEL